MIPIHDNVRSRHVPVVTLAIIVVNVIVFFFELQLPRGSAPHFFSMWGVVPKRLFSGGLLDSGAAPPVAFSLFTSMFLHGGWFHLISNMWILWLFGDNVEDRFGHGTFIVFYLGCGIGAMAAHAFLNPQSTVPSIGASGAIAGVMGAYFLLYPMARIIVMVPIFFYPFLFEVPAVVFLFVWITIQVMSGMSDAARGSAQAGGVAFWAHVGGFAVGLAVAVLLKSKRPTGGRVSGNNDRRRYRK
ncbi:MAG: rhomboid family intramembrane serine protease [Candidatus Pacebacteria bacterium]|nr:rhomboid family intramembrane serine protease [Candidatus Paceibacterota bacterium]